MSSLVLLSILVILLSKVLVIMCPGVLAIWGGKIRRELSVVMMIVHLDSVLVVVLLVII